MVADLSFLIISTNPTESPPFEPIPERYAIEVSMIFGKAVPDFGNNFIVFICPTMIEYEFCK